MYQLNGVVFREETSAATDVFHNLGGHQSPMELQLFAIREGVCGVRATRRGGQVRMSIKEIACGLSRQFGAAFCLSYDSFIGVDDVAIYVRGKLHVVVYGLEDDNEDREDDVPWSDGEENVLLQGPLQEFSEDGAWLDSPAPTLPHGRDRSLESDTETAARVLGLAGLPDDESLFRWAEEFPPLA